MPTRLASPVLALSIPNIKNVDTKNADNLFGMWTIFSRCADSLENGRRLENLSWRLWNKETMRHEQEDTTATIPIPTLRRKSSSTNNVNSASSDVPELSTSVESAVSDVEAYEHSSEDRSDAVEIRRRPSCLRRESSDRSRQNSHMTPEHLAKVLDGFKPLESDIHQWKAAFKVATISLQAHPTSSPESVEAKSELLVGSSASDSTASTRSEHSSSDLSTSARSSHSNGSIIIRGFEPQHPSSYRKTISPAAPEPKAQKKSMFVIGSSPSDGDGSSYSNSYNPARVDRSFLGEGLRRNNDKKTSFLDEVSTRTVIDEEEVDTEDCSESAIDDDDDSSDWDSVTESGRSSYEERHLFARVDSMPQLTSRRSLLTNMIHENDRAAALRKAAASHSTPALRNLRSSRNTSPNGPSVVPSLAASPVPLTLITNLNTKAINIRNVASSPRTTRRHMLATELTESLRQNLIMERSQKDLNATAVIKRRHTAHDMTKLHGTGFPAPEVAKDPSSSWNYYDQGLNEYHAAGW